MLAASSPDDVYDSVCPTTKIFCDRNIVDEEEKRSLVTDRPLIPVLNVLLFEKQVDEPNSMQLTKCRC